MTNAIGKHVRAGVLLLVVAAAYVFFTLRADVSADSIADMRETREVTIMLTEEGFMPKSVAIAPGTVVTFATNRGVSFWPASDIHPTHSVYPEFDPRTAVDPEDLWSYQFDKIGVWAYHDHLKAVYAGYIIVAASTESIAEVEKTFETCGFARTDRERLACFSFRISDVLADQGLDAAYDALVALYRENPSFTESCHTFAHDLGLSAYRRFGERVPLTTKVGYCNDGFFHGYMEGFFIEHDSQEARDFCDRVRARFAAVYAYAGPQCDHGIGHGIVEYLLHEKPEMWDDIPQIINEALSICHVQVDEGNLDSCASGAYSVIGNWLNFRPEYGDLVTAQDPYALCKMTPYAWSQEGCIWEFSKRIRKFFPKSPDPVADFVAPIRFAIQAGLSFENGKYLERIMRSMGHTFSYRYVLEEPAFLADMCRRVSEEPQLQQGCLIGIMSGLFAGGRPENGPERAAAFCVSEALGDSERTTCARVLLEYVRNSFHSDGMRSVCRIFGEHLGNKAIQEECNTML
ncbi:hypothetical protein A3A39_02300 [Candidatus Kaiserbacteria bacterium RIFCSPLOWO2_01_FULL_54_13]|uniref:EfeO-type cupredoxin-like domain-containing protein n=1 Tax=Candidatus Kaiserbacteria bacterium RIFCSPLOWO2_01_FULL_54_13 TaxID=1798512 RepID=A0A1F6F194_9BACT|nr:MAG: hypothetical protein A3A39_02300 [Candidatus Kaiserbacteria bacterium RIFCSPLOWO2_01_FULL_54_13]